MEQVGAVVRNLGLAPRGNCWICKHIAAVEHVNVLLYDSDGTKLPDKGALTYLRQLGTYVATYPTWRNRIIAHRVHLEQWLKKGAQVTPLGTQLKRLAPLEPEGASPSFLRVPDQAMNLGMEAMRNLAAQIDDLSPAELVQLSRLSLSAAGKMGDWHAKGRQMGQVDKILDIIADSGVARDDGD